MSLIKSKIKSLSDNYHFIVFALVLLALTIKHLLISIILIAYLVYVFIKDKKVFKIIILIIVSYLLMFSIKEVIYHHNIDKIKGVVINIENTNSDYHLVTINSKGTKYAFSTKEKYQVGDKVIGTNLIIENSIVHYPYGFDYQSYLHFKNVHKLKDVNLQVVGHRFTIHIVNDYLKRYIDHTFKPFSASFLKTLTIGDDSTLDKDNINKIGISHLFVISGLHVSIIILFVSKLLKLLKINEKIRDIILIVLIGAYIITTDFMISVIRVYLSLILKKIFKLSTLDTLSLNIITVSLINPFILFSMSFILSYAIAFFMAIYEDLVHFKNKFLNKIVNMYLLTILIQTFTLPITISINPDFNLISILINPIYIYFVTYIFLPLSIITTFIPPLEVVYQVVALIFENSVHFLANMEFLLISLGNISIYFKLIYWVIFYLTLNFVYRKKYHMILIYVLLLGIWFFKGVFNLTDKIYFLDLPEGDATIVLSKNNKEVIIIDTGEVTKDHAFTKIIKNLGIHHIDYLIITHSDSDHIGGAYDLVKYIRPRNLIFNYYDKNINTANLSKHSKNVYYLRSGDVIRNKYFRFEVLSPEKDYQNINDNSLTGIMYLKGLSILFMADASTKVENDLMNKTIDVDLYKVAHHGSITSTSVKFLDHIKYRYAVIMSGYYNSFGFPKDEVINRFEKEKLLLTKNITTIVFVKRGKNYKLKECKKILNML